MFDKAVRKAAELDKGFFMQIAVQGIIYALLAIAEAIRARESGHPDTWEER